MSTLHLIALVLLWLGTAVIVVAALGSLLMHSLYARLHFLTPITTVGAPLIGIGLAVDSHSGLAAGEYLLIVAVMAVSGPALEAATGRVTAQREGRVEQDSPQ